MAVLGSLTFLGFNPSISKVSEFILTTSSSKNPLSFAAKYLSTESLANSFASALVIPCFSATFSAVHPIGTAAVSFNASQSISLKSIFPKA